MEGAQVDLLVEQLRHANSLIKADNTALKAELDHYKELTNFRINELENAKNDHENRIRTINDRVNSFRLFGSLVGGGNSLLSAFALIKAYLGWG